MKPVLKAPFPYFGGKSRVASLVWERLGNVKNYVEPFFGSGAVLLARPANHFGHEARTETVNDLDGMLCNFWRAVKSDPDAVASGLNVLYAESEYVARAQTINTARISLKGQIEADEDFYDAKVAASWVYGQCLALGENWRREPISKGIYLAHGGKGLIVDSRCPREILERVIEIHQRIQAVRVMCGDWSRICGDSPTIHSGVPTGVFLDPPYGDGDDVYASDMKHVAADVAAWAIERGVDRRFRIAYCGYEGTVSFPDSWECVPWKANGGMANIGKGVNENCRRERIWFSPHCISPGLFGDAEVELVGVA
jgi:DNA adenine methylase